MYNKIFFVGEKFFLSEPLWSILGFGSTSLLILFFRGDYEK